MLPAFEKKKILQTFLHIPNILNWISANHKLHPSSKKINEEKFNYKFKVGATKKNKITVKITTWYIILLHQCSFSNKLTYRVPTHSY